MAEGSEPDFFLEIPGIGHQPFFFPDDDRRGSQGMRQDRGHRDHSVEEFLVASSHNFIFTIFYFSVYL